MKTKPSSFSLAMFAVVGALCSAAPVVAQVAGGTSTVGKVQDLIISPDANVSYVIVSAGGFVGIGRHDVAIPVTQIQGPSGKLVMTGAVASLENKASAATARLRKSTEKSAG